MEHRSLVYLPREDVGAGNKQSRHVPALESDGAVNAHPKVGVDGVSKRDEVIRSIPRETSQSAAKRSCDDRSAQDPSASAACSSSSSTAELRGSPVGTGVPEDRDPPEYTRTAFYYTLVNALTRKRRRASDRSRTASSTDMSSSSRPRAQSVGGGAKGGGVKDPS